MVNIAKLASQSQKQRQFEKIDDEKTSPFRPLLKLQVQQWWPVCIHHHLIVYIFRFQLLTLAQIKNYAIFFLPQNVPVYSCY